MKVIHKFLSVSIIVSLASCTDGNVETNVVNNETKTFENSIFYETALAAGYQPDLSTSFTTVENDLKIIQFDLLGEQKRGDNWVEQLVVTMNEEEEIQSALVIGNDQDISENHTGSIIIDDFMAGEMAELEFVDGEFVNSHTFQSGRLDGCASVRQVMYCAGSRLEDMNWVEQSFCFATGFAACMAQLHLSCYIDNCVVHPYE